MLSQTMGGRYQIFTQLGVGGKFEYDYFLTRYSLKPCD